MTTLTKCRLVKVLLLDVSISASSNDEDMETILLSLSKNAFQELITEAVNACLQNNQPAAMEKSVEDRWFDLSELCAYLPDKPAKPTVYAWVNQRLIPYHKGGKKLRFLKSEIDAWLKAGRQQTMSELAASADQFLRSNKKKSGGPKR